MNRCARIPEVLAVHLDGDVEALGTGTLAHAGLADHLRDCASCQQALLAARRLDAALAESSGRAMAPLATPERWDRLLATAVQTAPRPAPRRWLPRLLQAAALLLAGFALAWWWLPDRAPAPAPIPVPVGPVTTATQVGVRPGDELPFGALPPRRAAPPVLEAPALTALLLDAEAPWQQLQTGWFGGGQAGSPWSRFVAALRARHAAGQALLARGPAEGWPALCVAVDHGGDAFLQRICAQARELPALDRWLAERLRENSTPAALRAALRLGGPSCRQAMRRLVLRDDGLLPMLADAMRAVEPDHDAAGFLFDLWGERLARGSELVEDQAALTLFRGQPARFATVLTERLAQSRNAPERLRLLLALGALAEPSTRAVLLTSVRSRNLPEAMTAGWALGQLHAADLAELRRDPRVPPWLAQAVLALAEPASAAHWIDALEVTDAERDFMRSGNFTRRQFEILAALFRDRGPANH